MKQKLFQQPKPVQSREARSKSRNHNMVRDGKVHKEQTSIARPKFPLHQCMKHGGESNCKICRSFINEQ